MKDTSAGESAKQKNVSIARTIFRKKNSAITGLIHTSFGSVSVYDLEEDKVLYSQWRLLKSLGYHEDEYQPATEHFFSSILHPDDTWIVEKYLDKLRASKKQEVYNCLIRIKNKAGTYQQVALRHSVLKRDLSGKPLQLIGSMVNVSQYQCIKRQREKNLAMMENLAYRSSHELRAPVATLLGLIALLRLEITDQPHLESIIEYMEITTKKMDKVIKEFGNTLRSDSKEINATVQNDQLIADNRSYTLNVVLHKNRIYLKIKGYWRSTETVPNYVSDWRKALLLVRKQFTVLTDASEMKTHPKPVRDLHEEVQKMINNADVKKVAEVVNDDITEMQLKAMARSTRFVRQKFQNIDEAEKWLDGEG